MQVANRPYHFLISVCQGQLPTGYIYTCKSRSVATWRPGCPVFVDLEPTLTWCPSCRYADLPVGLSLINVDTSDNPYLNQTLH